MAELIKKENQQYETSRIPIIMKMAPIPEAVVMTSSRTMVEIITATIISFKRITAEVTGEIFFNPFIQR